MRANVLFTALFICCRWIERTLSRCSTSERTFLHALESMTRCTDWTLMTSANTAPMTTAPAPSLYLCSSAAHWFPYRFLDAVELISVCTFSWFFQQKKTEEEHSGFRRTERSSAPITRSPPPSPESIGYDLRRTLLTVCCAPNASFLRASCIFFLISFSSTTPLPPLSSPVFAAHAFIWRMVTRSHIHFWRILDELQALLSVQYFSLWFGNYVFAYFVLDF